MSVVAGVVLDLQFVHRRNVKRNGREERKERRGRPIGRIASLHSANRSSARDVLLWRNSRPAPPPGSASPCTNCGSEPVAHPHTRDLRRSGTTPRCRTVGSPLSRPSSRLHSKLRHTTVRLDSWLRCFLGQMWRTPDPVVSSSPLLDTSRDPTWVHFGTC